MKWTHEIRSYLYERLVKKYGPYSEWQNAATPISGKGERKKFYLYLEDFAKVLKNRFQIEVEPAAIHNQILWACQNNKKILTNAYLKCYIQNTYCALEQGFLTYNDLPTEASFILPKNKETKEIPAEEEIKNTVVQEVEQDVLDEISAMEIL